MMKYFLWKEFQEYIKKKKKKKKKKKERKTDFFLLISKKDFVIFPCTVSFFMIMFTERNYFLISITLIPNMTDLFHR